MSWRGNERMAAQSNILYGLGNAITAIWLEEGGAQIAEIISGVLTCGAGAAFMTKNPKAKIAGGILTAGDLGCCIAIFINSESKCCE